MNNYKCHEFQCVDTTMIVKYYVTLFLWNALLKWQGFQNMLLDLETDLETE